MSVSLVTIVHTLVGQGHNRDDILYKYSREEVFAYYKRAFAKEIENQALMSEAVSLGIARVFGGDKDKNKLETTINEMKSASKTIEREEQKPKRKKR